mmetsp:Transcript_10758/g.11530  ORF Transcript_10758/g.11530 Transcript_10758/m.11530 type:complete len:90 (+) Transcript_10758:618-887(+)
MSHPVGIFLGERKVNRKRNRTFVPYKLVSIYFDIKSSTQIGCPFENIERGRGIEEEELMEQWGGTEHVSHTTTTTKKEKVRQGVSSIFR